MSSTDRCPWPADTKTLRDEIDRMEGELAALRLELQVSREVLQDLLEDKGLVDRWSARWAAMDDVVQKARHTAQRVTPPQGQYPMLVHAVMDLRASIEALDRLQPGVSPPGSLHPVK